MTINAYKKQAGTDTPTELNRKVFNSIKLYLKDYKDTSKSKDERKKSIDAALVIVDWVLDECTKHATTEEQFAVM